MTVGVILGADGQPATASSQPHRSAQRRDLRARYDAAQTTFDNQNHWSLSDGLSADAAASPGVRRTLRNRSRYEVANNSYARGIVNTLAVDCVGVGPRLQLYGDISEQDKTFIEGEFWAWCDAIGWSEKLRTMRMARAVDGEAFGVMITNPQLPTRVQLDVRLIEAEQCASTTALIPDRHVVDGIDFDAFGNAIRYHVLRDHPGGTVGSLQTDTIPIPSADMIHYFAPERPGQRRGIPEITPALPLFAQLRRWTLAILAAAETAADIAGILKTNGGPEGEIAAANAWDRVELERRALMTLPEGWDITQFKAEHPQSTYADFKREIIGEIARCLTIPKSIALGDASGLSFAGGQLEVQAYIKTLKVERSRADYQILSRLFAAWRREAILIEGYLPQTLRTVSTDWSHRWMWPGAPKHQDPLKVANARATNLQNLTTTLADEWADEGADWEDKIEQIARERKKLAELGLTLSDVAPKGPAREREEEDEEVDAAA